MERNVIMQGDVLDRLRELPDGCVQTVVTSPPYWNLRDYGVDGQIGLEPTPAAYVARMVEVFRQVRRVLRDDGTCWLNLGDSYNAGGDGGWPGGKKQWTDDRYPARSGANAPGLKPKDLCGIPWRVAFALQDDGWYLRSDIVWSKPNPMPESVTDRPTRAHEYIFLLSKRARYYYDAAAIREPYAGSSLARVSQSTFDQQTGGPKDPQSGNRSQRKALVNLAKRTDKQRGHSRRHDGFNDRWDAMEKAGQQMYGANKRSVWTVATHPFADAHFATFPPKLIEPCILAGSSPQACETCGAPWSRIVETVGGTIGKSWHDHKGDLGAGMSQVHISLGEHGRKTDYRRIERGWRPSCTCEHNTGAGRCIVLDPFMGSGTVGLVAKAFGRDYVGIELNPEYVAMAEKRIASIPSALLAV